MKRVWLLFFVLAALVLCIEARGKSGSKVDKFGRQKKEKPKPKPKPPPVALNIDAVPKMEFILEEVGMKEYFDRFIRMGVTDSRLLLRVSSMDYRLMEMEWEDVTTDQMTSLKLWFTKL